MKSRHDLDKISPWNLITLLRSGHKKPKLRNEDLAYLRDVSEALQAQATPASSALIYLMLILTTIALVWASIAKVDEVTTAEARIIPSGREQVVTSLEGGLLGELMVSEGATVEKGQPLVRLEPTRFESHYKEGLSRDMALKATAARARAEAYGTPLEFPAEVRGLTALVNSETRAYQARKKVLDESVSSLKKSQQLIASEISISEKLAEQGLFSLVELSRLKRQENDLNQQIIERQNRYKADANSELVKTESELAQLKPNLNARLDTLQRTILRAPVNGIVKNIRMTTVGSAVSPSAPILDIVPMDARLLLEAKLNPKDVAYIHPGLPVSIKLSAYDSQVFGELDGVVETVSPDTFRDEPRPTEGTESGYYRVMIRAELKRDKPEQKNIQMIPGMLATAQIKTGEKTIMQYLLKPLNRAKEAFRER